ncbi:MAG: phage late control D family protein, partial [Acutalibacteraceae bacterium]
KISYSGKTAYVNKQYLKEVILSDYSSMDSKLSVGDEVTVTGTPQQSSTGSGEAGPKVTNYKGKITQLNQRSGITYPVYVGYLGWFSESQVKRVGGTTAKYTEGVASKGLRIQADIIRENWNDDGKDEILECGQFDLDAITASGPPSIINIKGTSLPYSSAVRQTKKSKSWENYFLSGIVKEIADKNDMAYMFIADDDPHYKRVEQYRKSDIAFLQKLCHDAGCSLKVTNNIIVVFDQAKNDKKSAVRTIEKGTKNDYISYTLRTGKDDTYTSCKVIYKSISATAYVDDYDKDKEDNQCLKIHQKVSSVAEAKRLAEKMLKMHNKYELTASFLFPGDPKLLAGCVVKLKNFGPWDGRYVIKQAKHTLSTSGYTTQITLRKVVS